MELDSAIVIGLQHYPGIGTQSQLSGAEFDAREFAKWLLSKDGGDVPEANISVILSSDYKPLTNNPSNCRPVFLDIKNAFEILRRRSIEKQNANFGPKIGRRLYLFMSGHGITPTPYGNISKEVGLLMSNVDDINIMDTDTHFPGCFIADWFCVNGCYDEVFLFMDCCRDIIKMPQSNLVFGSQGNVNTAKRFYAFATKWGRRAKERNINGNMRGVFTMTLLKALNGAGADIDVKDPKRGIITAASLKTFLINNTKKFLDQSSLNAGDEDVPDVDFLPNAKDGTDIIIKSVPLQKFPVIIDNPDGLTGSIDILRDAFKVDTIVLPGNTANITVNLPRGVMSFQTIINNSIVRAAELLIVYGIEEPGSEASYTLKFT